MGTPIFGTFFFYNGGYNETLDPKREPLILLHVQLEAGALVGSTQIHIAMNRAAIRSSGGPPFVWSVAPFDAHGTPGCFGFGSAHLLARFCLVLSY